MSVPAAPSPARPDRPALPIGLQIMAAPLDEERMLAVAAAFEAVSPARSLGLTAPL